MKNDQFSGEIKYTLFVCRSMSSLIKIFDASSYFLRCFFFSLASLCLVHLVFSSFALYFIFKKKEENVTLFH